MLCIQHKLKESARHGEFDNYETSDVERKQGTFGIYVLETTPITGTEVHLVLTSSYSEVCGKCCGKCAHVWRRGDVSNLGQWQAFDPCSEDTVVKGTGRFCSGRSSMKDTLFLLLRSILPVGQSLNPPPQ